MLKIERISKHPEILERAATLHWDAWGYVMGEWGLKDKSELVEEWLEADSALDAGSAFPIMFAAFLGNEFVGTVGLEKDDMPTVAHGLSPWLVSLIVEEKQRGKGFGRELVDHCVRYCKEKGIPSLHLWAEKPHLEDLYAKWGWTVVRRESFSKHESVPIMRAPL